MARVSLLKESQSWGHSSGPPHLEDLPSVLFLSMMLVILRSSSSGSRTFFTFSFLYSAQARWNTDRGWGEILVTWGRKIEVKTIYLQPGDTSTRLDSDPKSCEGDISIYQRSNAEGGW